MPLSTIVAGHILECIVYTSYRGQVAQNVFHYKVNSAGGSPTTDDIVAQVEADFNGSWKALMCDDADWEGISLRNLTPVPLEVASFSGAQNGPGVHGAPIPGQLCYLLTKKTAEAGPRGRGRMYIPFPGLDGLDQTSGKVHTDTGILLQTLIDDIEGPETQTAGGFSVNWTIGLYRPTEDVRFIPLRSFTASDEYATQRRRGAYGKQNSLPSELQ